MKKELTEKLFKDFPKIFRQHKLPLTKTAMCWGFQCGDGWYWLIYNLCNCIQSYIDNNPHLVITQLEATTVKEKFGGLRFYHSGSNEYIEGMVAFAEDLSYNICEQCGSTGEDVTQTKGYILTLCNRCKEENKK